MHKTTLEQWALLEKVVELGSLARVTEETNRSQSSASYNLALLQERLDVALLVPSGRRAMLTPADELLLNQVEPLLQVFVYVKTHTATLCNEAHTRLNLVVGSISPRQRLFTILRQFQQHYPQTQVRLVEMLENVDDESVARTEAGVVVLTRRQDITGHGEWLMNIDFIAVAHHDHSLITLNGPLEGSTLAPWPLVHVADQTGDGQATCDAWIFSTIDIAIDAVMYQVGFGWLPKERVRPHLDRGVLRRLPLSHDARHTTPLHLIVRRDLAPIDEQVAMLLGLFRTPREAQAVFAARV